MMTWTYKNGGYIAVVTADDVATAEIWLQKALYERGFEGKVDRTKLIPMVTQTRKVRVLEGGV